MSVVLSFMLVFIICNQVSRSKFENDIFGFQYCLSDLGIMVLGLKSVSILFLFYWGFDLHFFGIMRHFAILKFMTENSGNNI